MQSYPVPPPQHPRSLIGFLWSYRKSFLPGFCFAVTRILVISPIPFVFKRVIDRYMPHKDLRGILLMSLLVMALLVVHQFVSVQGAKRLAKAVMRMLLSLRAQVFEKIQFLSFAYLDRQKTGRLLSKYAFDTQKIDGLAMPMLNGFIPNSIYSLLTISIFIIMDWQLGLIVLLMIPIMAIMRSRYFEPIRQRNEDNRKAQESLTGTAAEYLGALRLVRSYGKEQTVADKLEESNRNVAKSRVELIELNMSFMAFSWASTTFISLVIVAGGAALSIYGKITAGTVIAFVAGLPALVQPIQMFSNMADQFFLGQEAYKSIRELLDESEVEQWHGTNTLAVINGLLEFDHVYFRYPAADRDALVDFTLTIQPGERVALVGPSGAGKSTVASLLLGLYVPEGGQIRIDGVPQNQLDMRWLRGQTALVMQESVLLSGSVRENIRFAQETATDEQVLEAARQANAEAFINQMPQGFDTIVGERGVMLSGGQRQRLAIARALLRNPSILILDEPTSALDYESERLIQDALDILIKGRTVITIAHRLSTIRNADRIIVLNEGKIVEQGTFESLSGSNGAFARMLTSQDGIVVEG